MTTKTKLQKYVDSLELNYKTKFVPFSQSRNAKPNPSLMEYSINWKVTIDSLTTDYMQGIGHLPETMYKAGWGKNLTVNEANNIKKGCENGKEYSYTTGNFIKLLTPPTIYNVLYSLLLYSEAIDYTFEDWCSNFGYEADSREAEKMYNECVQIGIQLRSILGNKVMEKLQKLYQDY